jgi:hypothetical protein
MPAAVGLLTNFKHFIKNAVANTFFYDKGMELTLFLSAKNMVSHI